LVHQDEQSEDAGTHDEDESGHKTSSDKEALAKDAVEDSPSEK